MSLKKGDLVQLNIEGIIYNLVHDIPRAVTLDEQREAIEHALLQKK